MNGPDSRRFTVVAHTFGPAAPRAYETALGLARAHAVTVAAVESGTPPCERIAVRPLGDDVPGVLSSLADEHDAVLVLEDAPASACDAALQSFGVRSVLSMGEGRMSPAFYAAAARAGSVLFRTAGEAERAAETAGPAFARKAGCVEAWIDLPRPVPPGLPLPARYVACVRDPLRPDAAPWIAARFAAYRRFYRGADLALVVVGERGTAPALNDPRHGIVDVGPLEPGRAASVVSGAVAFAEAGGDERLTEATLSALAAGVPVLAADVAGAARDAVAASGAGWLISRRRAWVGAFAHVAALDPQVARTIGALGAAVAADATSPDRALRVYERALCTVAVSAPTRFDVRPDDDTLRRLDDGRPTVLFAGAVSKPSCVEQLVAAFAFMLAVRVDAKLVVAGTFCDDEVRAALLQQIESASLSDRVAVIERPTRPEIAACFRSAALFWSCAEDGPADELLDALGYGVPILAFANPVAAPLLADAGLVFGSKDDLRSLGGIAALALTDDALRARLAASQRARYDAIADAPGRTPVA